MCNSSLQLTNSTTLLDEPLKWYMYCTCKGFFGTLVLNIITALFLSVGTPTYCWYLWLILRLNLKPSMVFPLNITIAELVFCFESIIDLIASSYLSVEGYTLSMFLIGLCWTVRPLLQICMCFEHYLAVIHPMMFLRYKDSHCRIALAVTSWLIGVGNGLRIIIIETVIFPDHILFLVFRIAVVISIFCCVSVLCALKRPGPGDHNNVEMREKDQHAKTDRGRAVEDQQKRNAFGIISHILVSILVCYLPQVIAYCILISGINRDVYLCTVFPLSTSITVIIVIISPLIRICKSDNLKSKICFFLNAREQK